MSGSKAPSNFNPSIYIHIYIYIKERLCIVNYYIEIRKISSFRLSTPLHIPSHPILQVSFMEHWFAISINHSFFYMYIPVLEFAKTVIRRILRPRGFNHHGALEEKVSEF